MINLFFKMPKRIFTLSLHHQLAVLVCVFSMPLLLVSSVAYADDNDTLNFIAGVSRQHDNNLFRTPSAEQSDNITTAYAGIRIDKPYSLQRFKFDYTFTSYKYQTNGFLDFNATDYNAAWLWALTPYLTGVLSADRKQQLNDFKDLGGSTAQNIRTTENQHFDADFSPHGNWHLLAGLTRSDQTNSQIFNEESDFSMNSVNAGLKYAFPSGSAITLMGNDRNGEYTKRKLNAISLYDSGFNETEAEAKLDWLISGKSKVNLRLAHVKREHDNFSQRDYSGEQGSLSYIWMPTGKMQLSATASRQLSSYQTSDSNYTRTDSLSISPVYSISAKITARANASISERTFLGDGLLPSAGRVDKEKLASIGIDWAPYRSVTLGANVQRSSRSSNIDHLDFTDTSAGLSAGLFF